MARQNKLFKVLATTVGIASTVALGGLFLNGTLLDTMPLGYLPMLVHQILGYASYVVAVFMLLALFKK